MDGVWLRTKSAQLLTYGGSFVGVVTSGDHETRLGVLHSTNNSHHIHPSI